MKLFKKAHYEKQLGIGTDSQDDCGHELFDIVFEANATVDPNKVCRLCSKQLGRVNREDAARFWSNFYQG
jgi:hypothetical protein